MQNLKFISRIVDPIEINANSYLLFLFEILFLKLYLQSIFTIVITC